MAKKGRKKVYSEQEEKLKNTLFTNFTGFAKNMEGYKSHFDVDYISNSIGFISKYEGRTKRFVMLTLLEAGLNSSVIFREAIEAYKREEAQKKTEETVNS